MNEDYYFFKLKNKPIKVKMEFIEIIQILIVKSNISMKILNYFLYFFCIHN
jgi:hypothetical protein